MPSAAARLLCVGDIHLGRRPSRLPDDLPSESLGPAAAWSRTVERALEERRGAGLDAVLLAGDVVESLEDRFEALRPLAEGVARLADAAIPVLGVAGNHDVHALPRLAEQVPGFHLLGAGGRWERFAVGSERAPVDVVGWSFATARVETSPLASFPDARDAPPTIGLLHCDLGARRSPYAPVQRAELESAGCDAWLLGHVHAPDALGGTRPVGYLGSLSPLDPGEPGVHGPWLVEVHGAGRVEARQLPLAPLRYEREDVPVDADVADATGAPGGSSLDVEDALHEALRRALERVRARVAGCLADAVACRLRIVGRTLHGPRVRALAADPARWPRSTHSGVDLFVESIEDDTRPALDLDALAVGDDPPGLLARRLLALECRDPAVEPLVERAARVLRDVEARPRFAALAAGDREEAHARARARSSLLRAARVGLETLLDQRAEAAP